MSTLWTQEQCIEVGKRETKKLFEKYPGSINLVRNLRKRSLPPSITRAFRNYHGWLAREEMKCYRCGSSNLCDINHKTVDWRICTIEDLESLCRTCHLEFHKNERMETQMSTHIIFEDLVVAIHPETGKRGFFRTMIVDVSNKKTPKNKTQKTMKYWTSEELTRLEKDGATKFARSEYNKNNNNRTGSSCSSKLSELKKLKNSIV